MALTVHEVLGGAYKGKSVTDRALLTHASDDDGETALCRRVKQWSLCDAQVDGEPTCPTCLARYRKRLEARVPEAVS